jgi:hypothetical protein
VRDGLVSKLGTDKVQQLLADVFAPLRDDLARDQEMMPDEFADVLSAVTGAATSTLKAAEYLMQLGDVQRWRIWFDAHSAQERAAILRHLERKRRRGK